MAPFKRLVFWGGGGGGVLVVPPTLGFRLNIDCPFSKNSVLNAVDYLRFLQFRRGSCNFGTEEKSIPEFFLRPKILAVLTFRGNDHPEIPSPSSYWFNLF